MSSQGAISSLVFSSSAVGTASSMGYVFGRPTKPKKQIKLSHIPAMMDISSDENSLSTSPTSTTSTSSSYSMYSSIVTNISSSLTNVSSKSFSKSPLKKFKLFGSSGKRSKLYNSTYILPPKTIHPHVVHPDQLVDDDFSSIYSADVADNSVYNNSSDRVRKTLSVPNLPVTIKQWDNSPSMSITSGGGFVPNNVPEIPEEEEEDWDIGFNEPFNEPLSKPARKSLTALPLSNPNPSPKRHNRCKSLPPINVQDFSPSLYHRQPTPSEIWDEDFELGTTNELNVPSSVEESQVSLRMDISNIRDFVSHIGKLKDLRDEKDNLVATIKSKTTRKYGFIRTKPKKFKDLENLFQEFKQDWLETNVIIDIADIAQDNEAKFKGGKRVEVDIDNIPSKRHMEIFEEIFSESLSENDDEFFENDKENQYDNDFNIPSKKQKLMSFCTKDDDVLRKEKRRRREENFRMSVEVMPSLIERLGRLQVRLNIHIQKLVELERNTI